MCIKASVLYNHTQGLAIMQILSFTTATRVALLVAFVKFSSAFEDSTTDILTPSPATSPPTNSNIISDSESDTVIPSNSQQQTKYFENPTSNPFSYLSCDSYLRPLYPHYFTHCSSCSYSAFSDWEISTYRRVPTYQCISGYVVVETRTRVAIGEACLDEVEERTTECKS